MATQVPVMIFSGNEHFRTSMALVFHTNDNIAFKSFTDVAFDERTESKAMEINSNTEIEEHSPLRKCHFSLLIFWLEVSS